MLTRHRVSSLARAHDHRERVARINGVGDIASVQVTCHRPTMGSYVLMLAAAEADSSHPVAVVMMTVVSDIIVNGFIAVPLSV
jgi:phosphohistidine phosphatase SixA